MATITINIAVLVLTCLVSTNANGYDRWNDDSYKQGLIDVREDCTSSDCLELFMNKRTSKLEEHGDNLWPTGRGVVPRQGTEGLWHLLCPCDTQYQMTDLGPEHYPRYLTAAHCVPKTCRNQFNPCHVLGYKVYILRKREASITNEGSEEQPYVEQITLPESLRMKWQMKPMKIPVACVRGEAKE